MTPIIINVSAECPMCGAVVEQRGVLVTELWRAARFTHKWFGEEFAPFAEGLSVELAQHLAQSHGIEI